MINIICAVMSPVNFNNIEHAFSIPQIINFNYMDV